MLKINQIKLPLTADEHDLRRAAGKALRLDENRIRTLRVTKKAVDSRKKDNIFFVYNVEVDVDGDENAILKRCGSGVETVKKVDFTPPEVKRTSELRPVIVGFGRFVIDELANHGAPEEIRWSAKPHIGTDRLAEVVRNIRKEIISLGGEIRFNCKMTDIIVANGYIHGVKTEHDGHFEDIETDTVLLCTGHSARDTVRTLYAHGVRMMQKPFSVGARIEHPREFIDRAQYGDFAGHPALGAADYKLACHPEHGRGAYTFCMCPGGTVVNAASEEGGIVVNGMSEYGRDAENSNSALLVGIEPENFGSDNPLAGMDMQRKIEHAAFLAGGSDYTAPAQLVGDFLADRPSTRLGAVHPSCPTGVVMSDLRKILPKKVTDTYADALLKMDKMLKGFAMPEAVFTAPETRSSSPVRILRDEIYQSNIRGLYPCGEGAGYAGGIVSAGVDGVRCAYAVLADENDEW